jgi:1-acyl-sn-glycerol-3-phosphate acyltransferase
MHHLRRLTDLLVTLTIWAYFTVGYVIFFSPIHLYAFFFFARRQTAFQKINCFFYRLFFQILNRLSCGLTMDIADDVRAIRGAVIVSNHISYFDPILLISLFPRQKTIVKGRFLRVPIFGWVLRHSGYIPSSGVGAVSTDMLTHMEDLREYLKSGGNLFIFPEGTRSRDGRMGKFQHGAFRIARRYKVPVVALRIKGTERVFPPGEFIFHTCARSTISVRIIGELTPDAGHETRPISAMAEAVRALYMEAKDARTEKHAVETNL